MQQIRRIHNCIAFKIGEVNYLYGLTYSYIFSPKIFKYKPHYLIIPKNPYSSNTFMHFGLDQLLETVDKKKDNSQNSIFTQFIKSLKGIVVSSNQIFNDYGYKKPSKLPTSLLKDEQHKPINQQQLLLFLNQQKQKERDINSSPFQLAKWNGQPLDQLKLIFTQQGNTILFCLGMEIFAVDPSQQIYDIFQTSILHQNYQIMISEKGQCPQKFHTKLFQLLTTVIITRVTSIPALINLLLFASQKNVSKFIKVIVTYPEIQKLIISTAERYFHMNQEIIRRFFHIRVLQPEFRFPLYISKKIYKAYTDGDITNNTTTNLIIKINQGNQLYYPHLQIEFGSVTQVNLNKKIAIYGITSKKACCKNWKQVNLSMQYQGLQLRQLPKNLPKLEYLILFRIEQELQKAMKTLPVLLRKKIIYNRLQNKYNHKYFVTLQLNKNNQIDKTKKFDVQIMTGPRHSKKYSNLSQQIFNPKQLIAEFLIKGNFNEYRLFDDMTKLGDYVTVFNNHSSFVQKTLQIQKTNPNQIYQNKILLCSCLQNSNQCQKYLKNNGQNFIIDNKWKIQTIPQYDKVNFKNSIVYVISGMSLFIFKREGKQLEMKLLIKDEMMKVQGDSPNQYSILIGVKECIVGSQPLSIFNSKNTRFLKKQNKSSIIHQVSNSFLSSSKISPYQLYILNTIGRKETYEIGSKANQDNNQKVFFISKGAMKWNYLQIIANSGYFIGNLLQYYSKNYNDMYQVQKKALQKNKSKQKYSSDQELEGNDSTYIEVLKDTWVIEFSINQFHHEFIKMFPYKLYEIYQKGQIFN